MQLEQVKAAIAATPKGANIVVEWVRPVETYKGVTASVTKSVRMVGRIGMEYDNLAAVQAKRESGELPAENKGLNGMEWIEAPWLLRSIKSGKYQIRLYNGTSPNVKPETHWFLNGVEVAKEQVMALITAKEKDSSHGDCFSCKVENMTRIHHESEWMMLVVGQVGQEKVATAIPVPASVLATMPR